MPVSRSFNQIGQISVGPQDRSITVGSFTLAEGHDSIWFRVTQSSPADVFSYAFGLLTWRSPFGKELGTEKVYGDTLGEVFRLGNGLAPLALTGDVIFTPRSYNRAWINCSDPPIWSLTFEAQSGVTIPDPAPAPVFGTASNSLVSPADNGLSLVRVDFS